MRAENPSGLSVEEYALDKSFKGPPRWWTAREDFNASPFVPFFQTLLSPTLSQKTSHEPGPKFNESIRSDATFRGCSSNLEIGDQANQDRMAQMLTALIAVDFTPHGPCEIKAYSDNPKDGYSYKQWIGQSHVVLHTYVAEGAVTVELEVCSGEKTKSDKSMEQAIMDLWGGMREFYGAKPISIDPADDENPEASPVTYPKSKPLNPKKK
jgi:S-adenosylmethionine/arginine decarboxylase-like enzyme